MDMMEMFATPESRKGLQLVQISTGGAAAPSSAPAEYEKLIPGVIPTQGYGLTETNAIATSFAGADYKMRPAATGLIPPTVEVQITHLETLKPLKPDEIGEVWIRGSNIMMGYYNDPIATKNAITPEGWFRSGDLGYVDKEGFLYVVDRAKDIIIRGGENIHCITIESALHTHPSVLEAAAVAVPDRRLGELVAAVVKLKDGYLPIAAEEASIEEDILAQARRVLPRHMVPVMILISNKPLDRNAPGKIVKSQLRKDAAAEWAKRLKAKGPNARL